MAVNVQNRSGKYQLRVTHKLLAKPYFYTFDDEQAARNYGGQLQALLDRGIVPQDLMGQEAKSDDPLFLKVAQEFNAAVGHAPSEDAVFTRIIDLTPGLRVSQITIPWAEAWVSDLKVKEYLAPSTIRKRVGLMARILDWHFRRITPNDKTPPANPLRLLPRNYSVANATERRTLELKGREAKKDNSRDRRLSTEEEAQIRAVLAGKKREDRERPHGTASDEDFKLLFDLILHTGMRLIEAVWQRREKIDLDEGVINVDGSKGWYGVIKPRTVPMVPELEDRLRGRCEGVGYLFPFWDGDPTTREAVSRRLSQRFTSLFTYAGLSDFTEHDLRHEATCRWVTRRNRQGSWMFSDVEICRIMGWKDTRMMLRYASLRGNDLAQRLRE